MKSEIIEKFDRQHYRADLLETVALFIFFANTLAVYVRYGS